MNNKLPKFLRNGEPASPAPLVTPLPPASPVSAANALGEQIASLIDERDDLRERLHLSNIQNDSLQARLDSVVSDLAHYRKKSEYYERFSMTIAAEFNTIRLVIDSVQRKADALGNAAPEPTVSPDDDPRTAAAMAAVEDALNATKENGNA